VNKDQIKGKWQQIRGEAKAQWGKLTDDDWKVADGDLDKLAGIVREKYGVAKEVVQKQVDELLARLNGLGKTPTEPARGVDVDATRDAQVRR
jgi:uncharacterized protein YjbJ (UPF0337 family)